MRIHLRFMKRRQPRPTPAYLLPLEHRQVTFHPSLRRAGEMLAEAQQIAS